LLDNHFVIGQSHGPIQENALGRAAGIGQLLRHESPSALKVLLFVKNVHGAAGSTTGPRVLHHELGHDLAGVAATGQSVRVFAVVREFLVTRLNSVIDQSRNALLTIVQVHKATNLALHVLLVAGVFETASERHGLVEFEQGSLVLVEDVVGFHLSWRVAKGGLELRRNGAPGQVNRWAHDRKRSLKYV
jgi:hypothetical protein